MNTYKLALYSALNCLNLSAQDIDPCKFVPSNAQASECQKDSLVESQNLKFKRNFSYDFQGLAFSQPLNDASGAIGFQCKLRSSILEQMSFPIARNRFDLRIQDETSVTYLWDSLKTIDADQFRIKLSINSKPESTSKLKTQLSGELESSKLPKNIENLDSLEQNSQKRESKFLSPGVIQLQSGLRIELSPINTIELGISSLKISWVSDRSMFDSLSRPRIAGIPFNENPLWEGGFSLQTNLSSPKSKPIRIEHSARVFYNIKTHQFADMELQHKLTWKIRNGLNTSLRSTLLYDESRWPPASWKTELSLGLLIER